MSEAIEIITKIIEDGITVVTLLTIINVLFNWHESRRKRMRYEAMEKMLALILEKEGIPWTGQQSEYQKAVESFWRLYGSLPEDIRSALQLRRERKMKINWLTLIPAVFGLIKLILQPFGIDLAQITDEQINSIANGVAAVLAVIGVFASHRKGGTTSESNYTIESNK